MTVVAIIAAFGWAAAIYLLLRLSAVQADGPAQVTSSSSGDEGKVSGLRKELTAAKDAVERKSKIVEELKAEAKKKARREGKKEKVAEAPQTAAEPAAKETLAEVASLKKAIVGLEKQIEITKKEASVTVRDAEKIAGASMTEKIDVEKVKAKEAVDARKKVERTLDDLRASIKKKAESRPDVPGSGLDLKSLPTEAVQELSRYFRKGEHFERLHGVAQGQLQLAQDRFNEQQKRYFAVCRELAVVAGKSPASDVEARSIAEDATQKTNAAVKPTSATSPKTNAAASANASAPTSSAKADDVDGDGEKKKRRRRRRRKKGEGEGAAAAGADGSSENNSESTSEGSSASTSERGDDVASNAQSSSDANEVRTQTAEASSDANDAPPAKEEAPVVVAATEGAAEPAPTAET